MALTISIVSHGHGAEVRNLLALLAIPDATPVQRVWLTLNLPDPELASWVRQPWPFDLQLWVNATPMGFGANHNQAFARELTMPDPASRFGVLNPDLSWYSDPLPALLDALQSPQAGCSYPLQLDTKGRIQDHRRALPGPIALLQRHLLRSKPSPLLKPEWVNAACLVFPSQVFNAVGGFDIRYYMYCEDVDLSLRLQLAGYALVDVPTAQVVHDASRASRRDVRHLLWHVSSLLRLWSSPTYRRFRSSRATATIRA
ncbi:MAG TPA: glycosyltransferase family 2 protein [Burkholderiaceae bacterium]|nr:glycosyltransferase family 2 protein [Burkholderiaceae bacterium]